MGGRERKLKGESKEKPLGGVGLLSVYFAIQKCESERERESVCLKRSLGVRERERESLKVNGNFMCVVCGCCVERERGYMGFL